MAAPRSTSLRALRVLSQQHTATPYLRRSLHITGSQSAPPTRTNSSDRPSLYSSYTLADLKNECLKRSLRPAGTKSELIERLSNYDILQSRAFSIAMRRINGGAFSETPSRQFNTSRAGKGVNDTSTVDFVYMPSMLEVEAPAQRPGPRIPVLPEIPRSSIRYDGSQTLESVPPMKPQVYTVSGAAGSEISASAMSDVVDNHAVEIDPFSLTETVGRSQYGEEMHRQQGTTQQPGIMKQLWSGIVDDLLGPKQQPMRK